MRFLFKKNWYLPFSLALVVLVLSGPGSADTIKDIQVQIALEKTELDKLKAQLDKHNKSIESAGAKESSVLTTLQKIDNGLKMKERELKIHQYNKAINQQKISESSENIAVAENQLVQQKQILAKRLRAIFKEGNMFPIKVLFSAENFNDLIQRIKYMELVTAYDSSLFEKYDERLKQLEDGKKALLVARAKLDKLQQDTLEKKR